MAPDDDPTPIRRVLTIAGSDSGGGAGIQADLKAFASCGVHGMTAITAVTAQNTVGVLATHAVPVDVVVAQIRAVIDDIGVDAVKVGMLCTAETAAAVAAALRDHGGEVPVVVDPVLSATTGEPLLGAGGLAALVERVLPLATVVTPNVDEARAIAADEQGTLDVESLVRAVHAAGPANVVLTGGDRERVVDVFFDGTRISELVPVPRRRTATHGSGCTHSAALAAHLALGFDPLEAARAAQALTAEAIDHGLDALGVGPGPVAVWPGSTSGSGEPASGVKRPRPVGRLP